jgi:hypothetical protein
MRVAARRLEARELLALGLLGLQQLVLCDELRLEKLLLL